ATARELLVQLDGPYAVAAHLDRLAVAERSLQVARIGSSEGIGLFRAGAPPLALLLDFDDNPLPGDLRTHTKGVLPDERRRGSVDDFLLELPLRELDPIRER